MLRVHDDMTVIQVKQLLRERDGLPINRCSLAFRQGNGRVLANEKKLREFSLDHEGKTLIDIIVMPYPFDSSPDALDAASCFDYNRVPVYETYPLSVLYSAGQYQPSKSSKGLAVKGEKQCVLDGYKVLDISGVELPEEVCRAILSNQEPPFNNTVPEHLQEFVNLTHLDVSGNKLSLEQLDCLSSVQTLLISCSNIKHIHLPNKGVKLEGYHFGFPHLSVLDMSYNFLSPESVWQLTKLPSLTDLNLAGNDLPQLPPDLTAFKFLKKLSLRRNRLGQQYRPLPDFPSSNMQDDFVLSLDYVVFAALSTLSSLEELDISENYIQAVPPSLPIGFKCLKFLNLSYNFIDDERKLIPLNEWPAVEWVDARGNIFNVEKAHGAPQHPADAYPFLYRHLAEAKNIKIVINQPQPSYLHDERHILRPLHDNTPSSTPFQHDMSDLPARRQRADSFRSDSRESSRPNSRALSSRGNNIRSIESALPGRPGNQDRGSRPGTSQSTRSVNRPTSVGQRPERLGKKPVERKVVTDSDQLAAIFGLKAKVDAAAILKLLITFAFVFCHFSQTFQHHDQIDDDTTLHHGIYEDDTFLTGLSDREERSSSRLSNRGRPGNRESSANRARPAPSNVSAAIGAANGGVGISGGLSNSPKSAARQLRYALSHPVLSLAPKAPARYERTTALLSGRQQPIKAYDPNKTGRGTRNPKVAEVYNKIEQILNVLDGTGGAGLAEEVLLVFGCLVGR